MNGLHVRRFGGATGRPRNFTVRRHAPMAQIVAPSQTPIERKVLRRVKAYRCAKCSLVFSLFSGAALIFGAQPVGLASMGLAFAFGVAALVYRTIEAPQEVKVRGWPRREPPVIHLHRED